MSKYYYLAEDVETVFPSVRTASNIRPVEVDDWHPASEPPKPEDFEPYGIVDVIGVNDESGPAHIVIDQRWQDVIDCGGTHWRRVTPPK